MTARSDREPMRPPRSTWAGGWLLLVAAGALSPVLAVLASGRTLAWRDTARLHAPLRPLVVEALRDVRLPLWNPHEGLGMPLFAQMIHGVLHPVSVAAALVAPGAGVDLLLVVHVGLAALGAALLARTLGTSRAAAGVAGLGFALSGYVLGMTSNLTYLGAAATAPWTIAALRAAGGTVVRSSPGWTSRACVRVAVAAVAVAALHFAGDPQWTLIAVALGTVLAVEAGGARGLWLAAAAAALGTCAAAVQLWPAWALLGQTARAATLELGERTQWSLSPWRLVELVSPGLFSGRLGDALHPVFAWLGGATHHGETLPFVPSVHAGSVLLVLAAAGVVSGSRRGRMLAVAAGLLLWIALGPAAGADQLLHRLPVWGSFRYPEKLVGPLVLCLALLAALGCDGLARSAWGRAGAVVAALAALCGASAVVLVGSKGVEDLFAEPVARAGASAVRGHLVSGLLHPALFLGALAALLASRRRSAALRPRFGALAAALVLLEGLAAAPAALHAGARGLRDAASLRALVGESEPTRIVTPTEGDRLRVRDDLDDVDGLGEAEARMGVAPYPASHGIDQLNVYSGLAPKRLEDLASAFRDRLGPGAWIAWRRYALTHVVVTESEDPGARVATEGGRLVTADRARGIQVYAVPHRPWAAFPRTVVEVAGPRDALDAVVAAQLRGDPSAIVEGGPAAAAPGTVLAVAREAGRARVEAVSAAPATLVVNDAFWPGWTAELDGAPVQLWRADALVRAVPWPPGRHVLELRYEPREVRQGIAVSAIAALVLVALGVVGASRRRRDPIGGRLAARLGG